jgi:uncharacterized membrane protein YkvA (DUF1232 family)
VIASGVPAIARLRDPQTRARLRKFALLAPNLVKLLWRLTRDPRVPARNKAIFLFVAGYLVSPIDFIPDFIPVVGGVEDAILAAVALDAIINNVPEDVVRQHWDGDEDVIAVIREIVAIGSSFLPRRLRLRLTSEGARFPGS